MRNFKLTKAFLVISLLLLGYSHSNAKEILNFGQATKTSWQAKGLFVSSKDSIPSQDWYLNSFSDSGWEFVNGPLCNSGVLPFYSTSWEENNSTYYLRRHFNLDSINESSRYYLYAVHDDGCIIYLNGHEIYKNENPMSSYALTDYTLLPDSISKYFKNGDNLMAVKVYDTGGGQKYIDFGLYNQTNDFSKIVSEGNTVALSFSNNSKYQWIEQGKGYAQNGNTGKAYSQSSLTFSFNSDKRTELSFDWMNRSSYSHSLELYIDGAYIANTTNSSYNNIRQYLNSGTHVVEFRDTISNSTYSECYSRIQNIKVVELLPLETSLLNNKSLPMTFDNNDDYPWTIKDGYIQNTNYGVRNSTSSFSTTVTVDKPSKFSFWSSTYYYYDDGNPNNYSGYQYFDFKINGKRYMGRENGEGTTSIVLAPGTYSMEWCDSIYNNSEILQTRISNMELSNNWIDVELASAGTLGVEVLYKTNVLTDVELLKIKGTLNSTDWNNIKQMTNLMALDLTEAKFDAIPDYAFDGLSYFSNIKLPEGMSSIGQYAFRGTQILQVDIPESVTSIGQCAFAETRLQNIQFAENSKLNTIGYQCFYKCGSLENFIMPDSVKTLQRYNNYTSLDYDSNTFRECFSLNKVYLSKSLTTIPKYCFCDCSSLTEVNLPKDLNRIEQHAFHNTVSLRTIDIHESLGFIGFRSFYNSGIDSIKLPLRLSTLEEYAFQNCSNLKYIELPSYIGNYSCNFSDCPSIQTVVCKSATPPSISNDPFSSSAAKSSITLKVPSFAVVNYKLDSYWYQFGSIVEGDNIDYWKITSALSLTNNRRMDGKPDVDLYYGGQFTVGGNAPMEVSQFKLFVNRSNPGRLLNTCESMMSDSITTYYSVSSNIWYFFTPMHDIKLSEIRHTANASFVFRYYNGQQRATSGTGNSWQNVNDGMLHAGQGYIFHCNANGDLIMPAVKESKDIVFTTGEITKKLTTYESGNSANKSWNYVGNPYPCYYDIYYMDFTAPITIRNDNNYYAYSISDDDYVLSPMQSFFVQKPDAVDNIVFRPEGRQLNTSVNRVAYSKQLRAFAIQSRFVYNIELSSDDNTDRTRVVLNEAKSTNYEMECDAAKFMSDDSSMPQLYTIDSKGTRMAINERPRENGIIDLGVVMVAGKNYTISSSRHEGNLYLKDNETGSTTDLTVNSYSFTASETKETSTRFSLSFAPDGTTNVEDAFLKDIQIIGNVGSLNVITSASCNIQVYSANGSLEASANKATTFNLPAGIYFVKVNGITTKIVVR